MDTDMQRWREKSDRGRDRETEEASEHINHHTYWIWKAFELMRSV